MIVLWVEELGSKCKRVHLSDSFLKLRAYELCWGLFCCSMGSGNSVVGGCWALFLFIALSSCWMGHTIYFADGETSRSRFGVFKLK